MGVAYKYRGKKNILIILAGIFLVPAPFSFVWAEELGYSSNNFGGVGLLEMRTARFSIDGTLAVGSHYSSQSTRLFTTWQATPWLETTLSYTDQKPDYLGVDRSLDVKIRLMTESDYRPALAIGIQDALGSGRTAAEYIVASKRYYDFDFTAGFSWGYLGSRGGMGNMFKLFGDRFNDRLAIASSGGLRTGSYFAGDEMAFFAGVEYYPPIKGLSFKAEYSGVDSRKYSELSQFKNKTAFNFGVNYRPTNWADIAVGFDHGDRLSVRLTLKQNLHKLKLRKWFNDPRPSPIRSRDKTINPETKTNKKTAQSAYEALKKADLSPLSITVNQQRVEVRKEAGPFFSMAKNIGRTARIMTREMPDNVEEFTVITEEEGLKTSHISLLRRDMEKAARYVGSPEEIWVNSKVKQPTLGVIDNEEAYNPSAYPAFDWGIKPELLSHFGGNEDGRFRADLYAKLYGSIRLTRRWQLSATLKQYIIGDLDKIPSNSAPNIPHVRSDVAKYSREGRTALERVKMAYTSQISNGFYARFSGGLLESMYGGVSAEVLYRPYGSNVAIGGNLNWVKQRDYDQLFSFRDYEIITGQATVYYENLTYNITSKLSAGRYLAGDYGATFDISRRFDNGIRIGVWASWTDMSVDEFGEGSFDKGIYLTLPLELFWYKPSREKMRFDFRSLGKDGGQMLQRGGDLYDMLSTGRKHRLSRDWRNILD